MGIELLQVVDTGLNNLLQMNAFTMLLINQNLNFVGLSMFLKFLFTKKN